jgi:putative glutamine amidotransferase
MLNVALGGTLYQHVPDQFSGELPHRQQALGIPSSEPCHTVRAEPGSMLEAIYGSSAINANSFHHQAIKDLAPSLRIEGRTDDGLIEAVALPGQSFVFGVQWHPEMMFHCHAEHLRPFEHFVAAATRRLLVAAQR